MPKRSLEIENQDGSHYEKITIAGCRVDIISIDQLFTEIFRSIERSQKIIVSNQNVHSINLADQLPWFREFFEKSSIVFCDGFGILLAAKILGLKIPYRYTPPDWMDRLCKECAQRGYSIFLLGSRPNIAERVAARLKRSAPELRISGIHHGFFDKAPWSTENETVLNLINSHPTQILLVGFGMPIQEKWLTENWERLNVNVALPVGAMFDYLAGETPRGPQWLTNHGFEWLTRLIIEPHRLWRRYLIGNPLFFWRVIKQKLGLWHLS